MATHTARSARDHCLDPEQSHEPGRFGLADASSRRAMAARCTHLDTIEHTEGREGVAGCEDCLAMGATWVHLRRCAQCGKVGCCDSSPNNHATAHHGATRPSDHPVAGARRGVVLLLRGRRGVPRVAQ